MCRFVVVDANTTGQWLVLFDAYGKCHLVRIATPVVKAIGWELHGPRAAMGLHFLVVGHSGQRLDGHFEALGVNRQTLHDWLHPTPAWAMQMQASPELASGWAARRLHRTPA